MLQIRTWIFALLAKIFCKGPDGRYFRLCRPCDCVTTTQLRLVVQKLLQTVNNEHGCVPIKCSLPNPSLDLKWWRKCQLCRLNFKNIMSVAVTLWLAQKCDSIWNSYFIQQRSCSYDWLTSEVLMYAFIISFSSDSWIYMKLSTHIHVGTILGEHMLSSKLPSWLTEA